MIITNRAGRSLYQRSGNSTRITGPLIKTSPCSISNYSSYRQFSQEQTYQSWTDVHGSCAQHPACRHRSSNPHVLKTSTAFQHCNASVLVENPSHIQKKYCRKVSTESTTELIWGTGHKFEAEALRWFWISGLHRTHAQLTHSNNEQMENDNHNPGKPQFPDFYGRAVWGGGPELRDQSRGFGSRSSPTLISF